MPIRVLIADDQAFLRRASLRDLQESPLIEVIADVADGQAAVDTARELKPDVVLLDIKMPKLNGIQAAQQIRAMLPKTGIVIFSNHNERQYVEAFLANDKRGKAYLLKTTLNDPKELIRAVETVYEGGVILDPEVVEQLVHLALMTPNSLLNSLTKREQDVLRAMAEGYTNITISQKLVISERTVESHINNIFAKLELNTDTEHNPRIMAVLLFLEAGN